MRRLNYLLFQWLFNKPSYVTMLSFIPYSYTTIPIHPWWPLFSPTYKTNAMKNVSCNLAWHFLFLIWLIIQCVLSKYHLWFPRTPQTHLHVEIVALMQILSCTLHRDHMLSTIWSVCLMFFIFVFIFKTCH